MDWQRDQAGVFRKGNKTRQDKGEIVEGRRQHQRDRRKGRREEVEVVKHRGGEIMILSRGQTLGTGSFCLLCFVSLLHLPVYHWCPLSICLSIYLSSVVFRIDEPSPVSPFVLNSFPLHSPVAHEICVISPPEPNSSLTLFIPRYLSGPSSHRSIFQPFCPSKISYGVEDRG